MHIQIIRGSVPVRMECAPAFNYARSAHTTELQSDFSTATTDGSMQSSIPPAQPSIHRKALFSSPDANIALDLRYVSETTAEGVNPPEVRLQLFDLEDKGHLGPGVLSDLLLDEGHAVWYKTSCHQGIFQLIRSSRFVLRILPEDAKPMKQAKLTQEQADELGVPLEGMIYY